MTRTVQDLIRELKPKGYAMAWTFLTSTARGDPVGHRVYVNKTELLSDLKRLPMRDTARFSIDEWNYKSRERWYRARRVTVGSLDPDQIEERLAHYG